MQRLRALRWSTMVLLGLGISLLSGEAMGQPSSLKEQLVGAWTYVSAVTVRPDGTREPMFGSTPQGLAIFDRYGSYALVVASPGLPRFTSNNRMQGTPEEYKAIVQGSISHFGRYTINEAEKTIRFRIEAGSFPNWNGAEQTRPFTLTGDELKWTTPGASGGGTGEITLKRVKADMSN